MKLILLIVDYCAWLQLSGHDDDTRRLSFYVSWRKALRHDDDYDDDDDANEEDDDDDEVEVMVSNSLL